MVFGFIIYQKIILIFSIDVYFVFSRLRHAKLNNILNTGLKYIYVRSLGFFNMNRHDPIKICV